MPGATPDPLQVLRSRPYVGLLVVSAALGIPISAAAYAFLLLADKLQTWVFVDLPKQFGSSVAVTWWPLVPLAVAGLLVGVTVKHLPGHGGEVPLEGFKASGGPPLPVTLPGIALAALASIGLGAVVGPEGPLIALGGGLAFLATRLARRDVPEQAGAMISAAGSFAAVSTLLGNPLIGAFLMMEVVGLGGATMELVLVPGLLASGVGFLVFLGLGSLTGEGTLSLSIPNLPHIGNPTPAELVLAVVIGLAAPFLIFAIRALGRAAGRFGKRRVVLSTVLAGVLVALLAIAFSEITGQGTDLVLFSGQSQVGPLITTDASLSSWTLLLLILFKGLAYAVSLSFFRGGPTFPAMFLGAAAGMIVADVTGIPLVAGVAMGIGAMTVSMLKFPFVSILLATLLLSSDGLEVMPLVIISVVVAYVVTAWLTPPAPAAVSSSAGRSASA